MLRYVSLIGTSIGRLGVASSGAPETWYRVSKDWFMFQGEATINGDGPFTFKVTAEDNGDPVHRGCVHQVVGH